MFNLCPCLFLVVDIKTDATSCWVFALDISWCGSGPMASFYKMTSILPGKRLKFSPSLFEAICHSSDSFFASERRGFSPHDNVPSPTASSPLWRWRITSCFAKIKKKSVKVLLLSGGSWYFGTWSCDGGWTFGGRIPLRGGAWDLPRTSFLVPHILLLASTSDTVFPLSRTDIPCFILWRSQYQETHKCNMVNPFGLGPRFSCEAFKVKLNVSIWASSAVTDDRLKNIFQEQHTL